MLRPERFRLLVLLLLFSPLIGCAVGGHGAVRFEGDPDRADVLAVVARSFEAIAAKGAAGAAIWREVLLDEGSMSSVRVRDGDRLVRVEDYAAHFARFDEEPDPRAYLERMWEPIVLVDGDIAAVWMRYDFWLDQAFSHGGTDVIVLLRTMAGWKIASFSWTAEPEATGSPLGEPDFGGER